MSIDQITQSSGAYQVQKGYLDAKRKAAPQKEEATKAAPRADKVEISEDAKKMINADQLIQEGVDAVQKLPDEEVRQDMVRKSEYRVATGHYDRQDVLEKIVDFLIQQDNAIEKLPYEMKAESLPPDVVGENQINRLELIHQRIADNFYDQAEVLGTIADKMLGA